MNRDVYPMVWRLLRQKRKRSEMAETPSSPDNNSGSNNNNRCNECNTLLPFGAKFCSNCGMQVGIEKDVYNVSGEGLVGKVKEIINDAKVKRINIKDDKGKLLIYSGHMGSSWRSSRDCTGTLASCFGRHRWNSN
jgi:hypothetical protein